MRSARLCVACLAGLLVFSAAAAANSKPKLLLTDTQPLTLRGQGFEAGELVRVSVRLNARAHVKTQVRAGAHGVFLATLKALRIGRCGNELTVTAVGARGSRVSWTFIQRECQD